ncbi:MAG: hypothetical protein RML12_06060 [Xanthomonadales bacterium]|nr:hypothetical protein [Xanthomonadales bacterium]
MRAALLLLLLAILVLLGALLPLRAAGRPPRPPERGAGESLRDRGADR